MVFLNSSLSLKQGRLVFGFSLMLTQSFTHSTVDTVVGLFVSYSFSFQHLTFFKIQMLIVFQHKIKLFFASVCRVVSLQKETSVYVCAS